MSTGRISPVEEKYRFSGHETFPFRYAWLPKGVKGIARDEELFGHEDTAVVELGVGKNMVRAIRFWCEATGLFSSHNSRGSRRSLTHLGSALFGARGWDKYLEDIGTLWLLHWQLVSRPERASTWYLAFTKWSTQSFDSDDLVRWILSVVPSSNDLSRNSLERDVEVFIRTYVPRKANANVPVEDTFDCPLVELGLIQEIREAGSKKDSYRFIRGPKPLLPDEIFQYALLDFWLLNGGKQKTFSFESLFSGPGSPGAAFKLSEDDFCERLERLPVWLGMTFDETAGLRQVLLKKDFKAEAAFTVLEKYYGAK